MEAMIPNLIVIRVNVNASLLKQTVTEKVKTKT